MQEISGGTVAPAPTPSTGQRWLAMLESGEVKSLREIAELEKLDERYIRAW